MSDCATPKASSVVNGLPLELSSGSSGLACGPEGHGRAASHVESSYDLFAHRRPIHLAVCGGVTARDCLGNTAFGEVK
jgi:hypothetical protein